MEAIRKQASKLREQVAKQQQAVMRQFASQTGEDAPFSDTAELERHEQLKMLYTSTRKAKHFQRDLVRGLEGLISTSAKQMEIAMKLADDCCKYSNENQNPGAHLASASLSFGISHNAIEKEKEKLLGILSLQVCDPLRAMILGAPLEDARHLTQKYDKIWQEVEAQAAEVIRCHFKSKNSSGTPDTLKMKSAESRLEEVRSILSALGKEAAAAMMSVEAQQQQNTLDRLIFMVEAERSFHESAANILNRLHYEMISVKQQSMITTQPACTAPDICIAPPPSEELETKNCTECTAQRVSPPTSQAKDLQANVSVTPCLTTHTATEPSTFTAEKKPSSPASENSLRVNGSVDTYSTDQTDSQSVPTTAGTKPSSEPHRTKLMADTSVTSCSTNQIALQSNFPTTDVQPSSTLPEENFNANDSNKLSNSYYIAEAIQAFDAQGQDELTLDVGDYVIVRQVSSTGWSEGECKGKAGWFPSVYVQMREKAPSSKLSEISS